MIQDNKGEPSGQRTRSETQLLTFMGSFQRASIAMLCDRHRRMFLSAKLEWDEAKNRANVVKHGVDFANAEEMFRGALLVRPDIDEDYGEERWIGIGMIHGRVALVAFAERPPKCHPDHLAEKGRS